MRRLLPVLAIALAAGLAAVPASSTAGAPHGLLTLDDAPVRSITVEGTGAAAYPAFDAATTRYGVTTTEDTAGSLTVTATTSDPAGTVLVDGVPEPDGTRTVTDLAEGDEVSVIITDTAGTTAYAFIYLPPEFPTLERDTALPNENPSDGAVLLTLALWLNPSSFFETAVDANGVPLMVNTVDQAMDLKPMDGGGYSVFRFNEDPDQGFDLVELDGAFQEVRRHHTVGLAAGTDPHDGVLMPDGSAYLMSYEPNTESGFTDAIVQQVAADGSLMWEWNTADHVDPATETMIPPGNPDRPNTDYAHINSMQVLDDGDLLLSFRHFSSVWKVARTAHDGFEPGDIVWKLGGRDSDFAFTDENDDPDSGPCAQHTAYMQPDGNVVIYDNGAFAQAPLCVDLNDPQGPPVARVPTRVSEWEIDADAGTAHLVWNYSYLNPNRYAIFAGSAERLDNGNTLIGWASARDAVASEVDAAGELVWDLKDPAPVGERYFTYRAFKADVPDVQDPVADLVAPADGATYVEGSLPTPDASCTDRGGSTLQTCEIPELDGTPGVHTYTVTATDGAENLGTTTHTYTVLPLHQPDAQVRIGKAAWTGVGTWGTPGQSVAVDLKKRGSAVKVQVRLANEGAAAEQLQVVRPRTSSSFWMQTDLPPSNLSPVLEPGKRWTFTVTVTRRPAAPPGARLQVPITVSSVGDPTRTDVVVLRVTALR